MKFDDTDLKLIRRLQRDARTNFASIAEECNVSVDTVIKRYQRMKKNGVVRGTTILLDPRNTGLSTVASMELDVEPIKVRKFAEQLRRLPGVTFCSPTIGSSNLFIVSVLNSVDELDNLRERLKMMPEVRDIKVSLWVGEILLCPENFELEGLVKKHG
jgi:DNA-binding Lrp family transcriptional regulator